MNDDFWTTQAMFTYGGSFVCRLGHLFLSADDDNREKIKATWPDYWSKYASLGQSLKAEDEAKAEPNLLSDATND